MAKKTLPKIENSLQEFFELFFNKDKFVVWIFGFLFVSLFLFLCYHGIMKIFFKKC